MSSEREIRALAQRVAQRVMAERGREEHLTGRPAAAGLERPAGVFVVVEPEQGVARPRAAGERSESGAGTKARKLVSASDLATLARGATLHVPADALVTELAREEAWKKQITISRGTGAGSGARSDARLRIALGADHGGFALKQAVVEWVRELGHVPLDLGTQDENPVDYPDLARAVAEAVAGGRADLGICVDGAGIGSAMAANKVPGVLAAMCYDAATARNAREHNHANVLTLGGRMLKADVALEIVRAFLSTATGGERHAQRVEKIRKIERHYARQPGEVPAQDPRENCMKSYSEPMDAEKLEEILAEIARQILEHGMGAVGGFGQWGCGSISVELCPERMGEVLEAGACRIGVAGPNVGTIGNVAATIDHTLLKPDATSAEIDNLCAEALKHRFASVCVNGSWIRRCAEILSGSGVAVCAVVGFPLGAMVSEVKVYEARRAIEDGACEIDMVMNVGALKSGDHEFVRRDIAALAQTCHRLGAKLKVILETGLLSDAEKVKACELAREAGADFVKTSTGFSKGGATVHDVALMRQTVGPTMGVKASGGVRDAKDAKAMLQAGATRLGASASVAIVSGARGSGSY